jgi:hypothetical protein
MIFHGNINKKQQQTMFYGAIIFRYIGASSVFVLNLLYASITGKRRKTFKEALNGKPTDDMADAAGYEIFLNVIGAITLFVVCMLIIRIEAWLRG